MERLLRFLTPRVLLGWGAVSSILLAVSWLTDPYVFAFVTLGARNLRRRPNPSRLDTPKPSIRAVPGSGVSIVNERIEEVWATPVPAAQFGASKGVAMKWWTPSSSRDVEQTGCPGASPRAKGATFSQTSTFVPEGLRWTIRTLTTPGPPGISMPKQLHG